MRIVIVEDEAAIRNGMGNVLKKINPEYELAGKAGNGLSGLDLIRKEQPDLVIMDIRMPDMDGLTMLRTLRSEGNQVKALVLSAYSEFDYAKEAIELGIENYLLKPIKLPELKNALEQVEKKINSESPGREMLQLEHIFFSCIAGSFEAEEHTKELLLEQCGFDMDGTIGLFMIWLGDDYREYKEEVEQGIQSIGYNSGLFKICILKSEQRQRILAVMYQIQSKDEVRRYLERTIAPMLAGRTRQKAVMAFRYSQGLVNLQKDYGELTKIADYSLILGTKKLLYYDDIVEMEHEDFKYPLEIENKGKQAVITRDREELDDCFEAFSRAVSGGRYNPKEVKEACLRYCYALLNTSKECGELKTEPLPVQTLLESITAAVTREQMRQKFELFYRQITENGDKGQDERVSFLVRRADNMIKEYYNQGITLEEISRKLGVSEEYLSARFKKETGATFTETIKKYRVDKIKELLLSTSLKLTQIAEKTGYTDPKYMSKVFRDETGMLPLEYRKMNL